MLEYKVVGVDCYVWDKVLICEYYGKWVVVNCDEILVVVGCIVNVDGLGLEDFGIELNFNCMIKIDDYLCMFKYFYILVCGDVVGFYQFIYIVFYQVWYVFVNGLFGLLKKFKVDYLVIFWVIFIDFEVVWVGFNELEVQECNIFYEVICYFLLGLDCVIIDDEIQGFVKVFIKFGKDKILGVIIVVVYVGELIVEYVLVMKYGLGLNKLFGIIYIYFMMNEVNKNIVGEWCKNYKFEWLLCWVE